MKQVLIHALLATFGLVAAYETWTREEVVERPPGEVTILECSEGQLASVQLRSPTQQIDVAPSSSGTERTYWITTQPAPPAKPGAAKADGPPDSIAAPDAGAAPAVTPDAVKADAPKPNPAVEKLRKPRRFLASAKFGEYVAGLTPLRAVRGLGVVPKEKFSEFGFDKVGTYIDVACGTQKLTLEVGERTYGTGKRYVREQKSGQVYLFDGAFVQDLQSAEYKFMQKELHSFTLADVDEAQVVAAGAVRKLVHRNRLIKEQARWVDAAEPDTRNELFGNWFERVGRLKVREYLPEGAEPGSDLEPSDGAGALTEVVRIEYAAEGKPKGKLTIARIDTATEPHYYAKTETTGHWVAVFDSVAKQVEGDVPMLMGKEEPPSRAPAGTKAGTPAPTAAPASPHAAPPASPHAAPPASPHAAPLPSGHPPLPAGH